MMLVTYLLFPRVIRYRLNQLLIYCFLYSAIPSSSCPRITSCQRRRPASGGRRDQGPDSGPDHREGQLLCTGSQSRTRLQLHMPGWNHSSLDVSRLPGVQGLRRAIVPCRWLCFCRLSGAKAATRQGVRRDNDVRHEELDLHADRILPSADVDGASGNGHSGHK